MKNKIKLQNGLRLNKETIVKLQESQMANLRGGVDQKIEKGRESCWYLLSCLNSCGGNSCNTTTPTKPVVSIEG